VRKHFQISVTVTKTVTSYTQRHFDTAGSLEIVERVKGIEPSLSAWETNIVLPIHGEDGDKPMHTQSLSRALTEL